MSEDKKQISSLAVEEREFAVPENLQKTAYIRSMEEYERMH